MKSEFYLSFVRHKRFFPRKYEFDYKFFWTKFNIDELDALHHDTFFFSRNSFNLISFYDRDHFNLGFSDTRKNIEAYFKENGIAEDIISIELVTNPRILGYTFNPVSFYFIQTTDRPYVIIAIGNTFNEQKPYLVRPECLQSEEWVFHSIKEFYISPFISAKNALTFKIKRKDRSLVINIDDHNPKGELELTASFSGRSLDWSTKNLLILFFTYPFITFRIIFSIHYHALKLFLLKIPYYKKSDEKEIQTNLFSKEKGIFSKKTKAL